ncbi:unnamed protein product [Didymodactylos carnosus]|uniref:Uncharacterized protein n=1 Tax=Didymodactylos carnosus TaxID=1234261 RepID=A0A815FB89_9BILA|nr:unnamed protein product [Didymodactylos carnosus]CAF4170518.1 unnamed protein product [Didymodactylos carnosus]
MLGPRSTLKNSVPKHFDTSKSLEEEIKHYNLITFGELIDKILSSNKFIKQLAELIQKEFQSNGQTIITFADRLGQLENKPQ